MMMRGLAWLSQAAGGFLFLFGGRAISEIWKIDRILAEFIGLGLAAALIGLGIIIKRAAGPDDDVDDAPSKRRGTI